MACHDVIISGWLLKKSQSAKLVKVTRKYQKRWCELTQDAFAYAKDPNEVQDSKIELFSMEGCTWVKRVNECTFEMQFQERLLRCKAETPGEAGKWLNEIQKLLQQHMQREDSQPESPGGYSPLPSIKGNTATMFTIEADSDDDNNNSETDQVHSRSNQPNRSTQERGPFASAQQQNLVTTQPVSLKLPSKLSIASSQGEPQQQERPPSPRSLLAKPKLGGKILASSPNATHSEELWAGSMTSVQSGGTHNSQLQSSGSIQDPESTTLTLDTPEAQEQDTSNLQLELPRPAFNTSLRSTVMIQDEAAPALRSGATSACSSPLLTPRTSNPLLRSLPRESSATSTRRQQAPREDVLVLDDKPATQTRSCNATLRSNPSRPTSGLSQSRLSTTLPARASTGMGSLANVASRLPDSKFAVGSAAHGGAAGSHTTDMLDAQSSAQGTEKNESWADENWDSSDSEEEDSKPSTSTAKRTAISRQPGMDELQSSEVEHMTKTETAIPNRVQGTLTAAVEKPDAKEDEVVAMIPHAATSPAPPSMRPPAVSHQCSPSPRHQQRQRMLTPPRPVATMEVQQDAGMSVPAVSTFTEPEMPKARDTFDQPAAHGGPEDKSKGAVAGEGSKAWVEENWDEDDD